MTIIKFEELQLIRTNGKPYKIPKKVYHLQCDNPNCKKEYTADRVRGQYQFCSNACKVEAFKKDGVLDLLQRKVSKEKFGTEYINQAESVKQTKIETSRKNWGTDYPSQSPIVKEKIREANQASFGADNYFQTPGFQEEYNRIMIEKYGDIVPIKNPQIKQKRIDTLLKRYGVDSPNKNKQISQKRRQTFLDRYGFPGTLAIPKYKEAQRIWRLYGPKKDPLPKTWKGRTDFSWTSKAEDKFYRQLCDHFGKEDVVRPHCKKSYDFFIKTLRAWICFDGLYWHGLNKDIEIIKKETNPRSKSIYQTYLRDQKQNRHYGIWNKTLVRITDLQYQKLPFEEIIGIIHSKVKLIEENMAQFQKELQLEYETITYEELDNMCIMINSDASNYEDE